MQKNWFINGQSTSKSTCSNTGRRKKVIRCYSNTRKILWSVALDQMRVVLFFFKEFIAVTDFCYTCNSMYSAMSTIQHYSTIIYRVHMESLAGIKPQTKLGGTYN